MVGSRQVSLPIGEERIEAIAKGRGFDSKQILQKILVAKALDSEHLESCIEVTSSACEINSRKIKLLIVDSIINHYNAEYMGRSKLPEKIQRLNKSMHMLLKTASSNAVAVVVTNHQIQSSVDGPYNRVTPLGGNAVSYVSKYRIHLDRYSNSWRARLDLSPCHPQAPKVVYPKGSKGTIDPAHPIQPSSHSKDYDSYNTVRIRVDDARDTILSNARLTDLNTGWAYH
jgi:DNA repair protein RadA